MTSLADKLAPELDELVGDKKVIDRVIKYMKNAVPCILYGKAGVGKTSTIYAVAKELGFKVIESNASDERRKNDLEFLLRRVKMRSFRPVCFLLDEADGFISKNSKLLGEVVSTSKHPIVLTANNLYKIPKSIRDKCEKVKIKNPSREDVLKRVKEVVKKIGIKPIYGKITRDVRSSIMSTAFGGETYVEKNDFNVVQDVLTGKAKEIPKDINIWILDNATSFYKGRDLYKAINLVCLAEKVKRPEILKSLPVGRWGKVNFPRFLRKASMSKKKGKKI